MRAQSETALVGVDRNPPRRCAGRVFSHFY